MRDFTIGCMPVGRISLTLIEQIRKPMDDAAGSTFSMNALPSSGTYRACMPP
jgi:hypothetical protein